MSLQACCWRISYRQSKAANSRTFYAHRYSNQCVQLQLLCRNVMLEFYCQFLLVFASYVFLKVFMISAEMTDSKNSFQTIIGPRLWGLSTDLAYSKWYLTKHLCSVIKCILLDEISLLNNLNKEQNDTVYFLFTVSKKIISSGSEWK